MVSFTLPANAASRRVREKAGLGWEGEGRRAGRPPVFTAFTPRNGPGAGPQAGQPLTVAGRI